MRPFVPQAGEQIPNIEAIESDQTRRLQLLLEKRGVIGMEDAP